MVGCNLRLEPNGYKKKNYLYIVYISIVFRKRFLKFDLKLMW